MIHLVVVLVTVFVNQLERIANGTLVARRTDTIQVGPGQSEPMNGQR